jgi:hypothetical protein
VIKPVAIPRSFSVNPFKCETQVTKPTAEGEEPKRVKLTSTINRVILIGRAGAVPVVKKVKDLTFATFSLATDTHVDKDGNKVANWHNIVTFDDSVINSVSNISKG